MYFFAHKLLITQTFSLVIPRATFQTMYSYAIYID